MLSCVEHDKGFTCNLGVRSGVRSDINQPAHVQRKSSALKPEAMVVVDNKDADQTSGMLSLSWVFGVHI